MANQGLIRETNESKKTLSGFDDIITSASSQHGVDPKYIRAVIKSESNFDPKAVSPVGAKGLMQLMDPTARDLGVTDSFDPQQNVMGGTKYLAQNLKRYGGDPLKAAAAYNAGPGNIDKAVNRYGDKWLENLHKVTGRHADETRQYLKNISKHYSGADKPSTIKGLTRTKVAQEKQYPPTLAELGAFGYTDPRTTQIHDLIDRLYGPEEIAQEPEMGRTLGGTLGDIAVSAGKGIVGAGEAAVGLADILTGGRVGKAMEERLGYDPETTQDILSSFYSPAQRAASEEVERAEGFVGKLGAMFRNPSTIGHEVIKALPGMLGGAAAARKMLAIGVMESPLVAAAVGEGLVSAGSIAEEIRQQTEDGLLTPEQAIIPLGAGIGTSVFALAGGRVVQKFGLVDIDTLLAGGSNVTNRGVIKRIIGGGISEGVFEELPQSAQEQIWLNSALDKPLLEGVPEAGATGLLTGAAMGGGANIAARKSKKDFARNIVNELATEEAIPIEPERIEEAEPPLPEVVTERPEVAPEEPEVVPERARVKPPTEAIPIGAVVTWTDKDGKVMRGIVEKMNKASYTVKGEDGKKYAPRFAKVEAVEPTRPEIEREEEYAREIREAEKEVPAPRIAVRPGERISREDLQRAEEARAEAREPELRREEARIAAEEVAPPEPVPEVVSVAVPEVEVEALPEPEAKPEPAINKPFIENKVKELGSIEAVEKFYDTDDAVSRYALEYAQKTLPEKEIVKEITKPDEEKRKDLIQMVEDQIATHKAKGRKVPKHLIQKLAELKGVVREDSKDVAGAEVFGHPSATNLMPQKYGNLVPIKASTVEAVDRRIDKAQGLIDKLQSRIVKRKGVKPLNIDEETILDLLRHETMPELNRMHRELSKVEPPIKKPPVKEPEPEPPIVEEKPEVAEPKESIDDIEEQVSKNKIKLYRIDYTEPDNTKPHGAYYNVEFEGFESPHKEDFPKGKEYRKTVSPNKPLMTDAEALLDSAGVSALKTLIGRDELIKLKKMGGIDDLRPLERGRGTKEGKKILIAELFKKYPDIEWNKYYDSREILEGFAGIEARKKGYDAIIQIDKNNPEMSEYVDLSKKPEPPIIEEKPEVPKYKEITPGATVTWKGKGDKPMRGTVEKVNKASYTVMGNDGKKYAPKKEKVELVEVEPPIAKEYIKPSAVETPAQGVLNQALDAKRKAFARVKSLRDRIKKEPLGGDRQRLRLELIKAEDTHKEAIRSIDEAKVQIEKRARELGKTTVKIKIETDEATIQRIKNSIAEGELILKEGEADGRKYSPEKLEAIRKHVEKQKARLGIVEPEVKPVIEKPKVEPPVEEPIEKDIKVKVKDKDKTVSANITRAEAKSLGPKEQKEFLMAEIDKTLKDAPDVAVIVPDMAKFQGDVFEQNEARIEKLKKDYGIVTFKVPDDGIYEILNTKESLTDFKKKAKKFPLKVIEREKPFKKPGVRPSDKRLVGEGIKYYNPYAKSKQKVIVDDIIEKQQQYYRDGYYSDGKYLIKTEKPKTKKPLVVGDKAPNLKQFVDKIIGFKSEGASFVGVFYDETQAEFNDPPLIHVKTESGKNFFYNSLYVDAIRTKYPNSEITVSDSRVLAFKQNGKVVGAIQPSERKDIDFKDLKLPKEKVAKPKEPKPVIKPEEPAKPKEIKVQGQKFNVNLLTDDLKEANDFVSKWNVTKFTKAGKEIRVKKAETIQAVKDAYFKKHHPDVEVKPFVGLRKEPKAYAITEAPPLTQINLESIKAHPRFKTATVTQDADGKISIKFKNNLGFIINSIESIDPGSVTLNVGYGRHRLKPGEQVAGFYDHADKSINIVEGVGDRFTIDHEFTHFLEKSGVLTSLDVSVLNNQIKKMGQTPNEETRARFVEDAFRKRDAQKRAVKRILQKIADFIDLIVNKMGIRTALGIVWDIETGKIISEVRGEVATDADILYSTKEDVPDFIHKLFKTDKKKPLKDTFKEIGETVKTSEFWDGITTQVLDRLHPIKKLLGEKAYKLHRLATGNQATFAMLMEHGKLGWDESGVMTVKDRNDGFLPFLRSLGPEWKKFFYWTAAKRAEVLAAEDPSREKWLTEPERKKIFEWAGGKDNPQWIEANKKLKEFNANVLDTAQEAGLIDPEARKVWEQEFYVPFYRIFEDVDTMKEYLKGPVKGKKFLSAQIKRLRGAEKKLGDPLENLMHNWMHLISTSMENKARSQAFDYAQNMNLDVVEQVPKNKVQVYKRSKDGKLVFVFDKKHDNVLMFQKGGKPIYFKVNDPSLYNALGGLNVQKFDSIIFKGMHGAKQLLTFGVTIGPAFRIANAFRDTLHTSLINKSFIPFVDTYKGLVKSMKESPEYIEFMASGAGFGSSYIKADNPEIAAKYINRIVKKEGEGARGGILNTTQKMWDFWEKIGTASENAARVELFTKLTGEGVSKMEAAFQSRDLLDFTMSGASNSVQMLIRIIPFLNARVQGLYKLGRTAADKNTRKNLFIRGMMLASASTLLWLLYKDDDEYKELEDWDKWSYHHFWIGKQHFRLPRSFEVGAIFSSLPETILSIADGEEEIGFLSDFIGHTLAETFSFNPIPQLFKPLMEQWGNKSFFTGRDIVPQWQEGLLPEAQKDPWTSKTLQLAGEFGISPKRANQLVYGYLGALGVGALAVTDILVSNLADFPDDPTKEPRDYPAFGRFFRGSGEARSTKYKTRYYEMSKEVDGLVKTINFYKKMGDIEKARALYEKSKDKIRYRKAFNAINNRISKINRRIKWTYQSDLSPDEKRVRVNKLNSLKNRIFKRSYDAMLKK